LNINYSPLPESATFSLGGFTCFKPEEWNRFLRDTIRQHHPFYYFRQLFRKHADSSWNNNDCIFESLKKYLLCEFGIHLPADTIFKVFNEKGEGVLPGNLVRAITAVIEPLGLEIDRIIVPNAILRNGLGCPEKTVDESYAADFDQKPGICMIHIEGGNSHAFFWQSMDVRKFKSDPFRMALQIRRKFPECHPTFSALQGLEALRKMFSDYLVKYASHAELNRLGKDLDEIISYTRNCEKRDCDEFRSTFDTRLATWLLNISNCFKHGKKSSSLEQTIIAAGQMVRNIFSQIQVIQ
jgi:hypothetical protein